jgi:phosphoribosylformylglycinamidine cyclo-ligase
MVTNYKKVGVDIAAIKKSQNTIGRMISSTHKIQKLAKVAHGFGHYAGIVQIPGNKFLATHTDGVGTKIMIANMMKKYDTIGVDCIAMNVNDIICIGATPVSFVDYIAANKNNQHVFKKVVGGLVKGARQAQVPIIGGETAELPGLYAKGDFDLAGFVVGIVEKDKIIGPEKIKTNAKIYALNSSGFHSNGFTLIRKWLNETKNKPSTDLIQKILTPTKIYHEIPKILDEIEKGTILALANITGGGISGNLPRVIPDGFECRIKQSKIPTEPWMLDFIRNR